VSHTPLVSVITPAFNTAQYVGRAISSVLTQSMPDVELLVVDDGSTDETLAVVRRCAERDARVRVFSQANGGVAKARNRAIREARAPFIALLDSDDEWMPHYLERQMHTLAAEGARTVVTANAFNRGGAFDGRPFWPARDEPQRLTIHDLIAHEDSVCIMSVFSRAMHAELDGYDESFVGGSEDYDFWLRAASRGYAFIRTWLPIAFYQRRPDSLSARPIPMLNGISNALRKLRVEIGETHPDLRALIDRRLVEYQQEALTLEAKVALRQGDFATAAQRFNELHLRRGGTKLGLLAAWSRIAPSSLAWVDGMRRVGR
jgi:glycosyltransferase involved in cell wall biosynthesis